MPERGAMMDNIPKNAIELSDEEVELVNGGAKSINQYYVVQRGDTLDRIAHRFGTTIEKLKRLNPNITDPTELHAGDRILVM